VLVHWATIAMSCMAAVGFALLLRACVRACVCVCVCDEKLYPSELETNKDLRS